MRSLLVPATNRLLMLGILTTFIGTFQPTTVFADYSDYDCRAAIDKFLNIFGTGDKNDLSRIIDFPLVRPYPIPSIERDEFIVRYHEVFDDEFVRTIAASKLSDWSSVGWRGIMLHNGLLWIRYDGTIRSVNYRSKFEVAEQTRLLQLRDELREQERGQLHYSLRQYFAPVLDWKTDTYRIRIDQIHENEYRYAAWRADASHDANPASYCTKELQPE